MAREERGEDYPDKGFVDVRLHSWGGAASPAIASPVNHSNDNRAEKVRDETRGGERERERPRASEQARR